MNVYPNISVGVVGVGRLGAYHLQQYQKLKNVTVVGFYDVDVTRSEEVKLNHNVELFKSLDHLLPQCDAVSIATPTTTHFSIAKKAILNNCHVLIEKPITSIVQDAKKLLMLAEQENKIIQVGHIERFNPAFNALNIEKIKPVFVESHRIAPFNTRGIDVDVILDLMIHDIDVLLALVRADVKEIRASGVSVLSKTLDTANARIEFDNGCVANLTASRIAQKKIRKFRFFEKKSYTTIDFLNPCVEKYILYNKKPANEKLYMIMHHNNKYILYDKTKITHYNALYKEIEHFIDCVATFNDPLVGGVAGFQALRLALKIQDYIKTNKQK